MQTEEERERQELLAKAQRDLEGLGWQAGHAELIAGLAVELKLTKRRLVALEERAEEADEGRQGALERLLLVEERMARLEGGGL